MKLLTLVLFICMTACGQTKKNAEVYQTDGKAIKGYDVVAFFSDSKPVQGNEQYSYNWNDAKWLFSNHNHLETFKNAPEKYAPQYGGYCAYGTAAGYKAPTQTETWTIIDGKLYFNYNQKVKELWNKKPQEYIQQADKNWPAIKYSKL